MESQDAAGVRVEFVVSIADQRWLEEVGGPKGLGEKVTEAIERLGLDEFLWLITGEDL